MSPRTPRTKVDWTDGDDDELFSRNGWLTKLRLALLYFFENEFSLNSAIYLLIHHSYNWENVTRIGYDTQKYLI